MPYTPNRMLRLEVVEFDANGERAIKSAFGYIHSMSIVAVIPSFVNGGSVIIQPSGALIRVSESPDTVVEMLYDDD